MTSQWSVDSAFASSQKDARMANKDEEDGDGKEGGRYTEGSGKRMDCDVGTFAYLAGCGDVKKCACGVSSPVSS